MARQGSYSKTSLTAMNQICEISQNSLLRSRQCRSDDNRLNSAAKGHHNRLRRSSSRPSSWLLLSPCWGLPYATSWPTIITLWLSSNRQCERDSLGAGLKGHCLGGALRPRFDHRPGLRAGCSARARREPIGRRRSNPAAAPKHSRSHIRHPPTPSGPASRVEPPDGQLHSQGQDLLSSTSSDSAVGHLFLDRLSNE